MFAALVMPSPPPAPPFHQTPYQPQPSQQEEQQLLLLPPPPPAFNFDFSFRPSTSIPTPTSTTLVPITTTAPAFSSSSSSTPIPSSASGTPLPRSSLSRPQWQATTRPRESKFAPLLRRSAPQVERARRVDAFNRGVRERGDDKRHEARGDAYLRRDFLAEQQLWEAEQARRAESWSYLPEELEMHREGNEHEGITMSGSSNALVYTHLPTDAGAMLAQTTYGVDPARDAGGGSMGMESDAMDADARMVEEWERDELLFVSQIENDQVYFDELDSEIYGDDAALIEMEMLAATRRAEQMDME